MFRKATCLLLPTALAVTALGTATPASARPLKETFRNEGIFALPDIDCGTFWLTEEMTSERVQSTTHLDQAGEPVKVTTHANFMGVVTNTETGETFRDHAAFTETLDLVAGTTAVSGASYHYIVTGQGSVYAEVGHKVTVTATGDVIFQAGQDDFVGSDLAGLCVALA